MTTAAASETPGQRPYVTSRIMAAIMRAADAWPTAVCSCHPAHGGPKRHGRIAIRNGQLKGHVAQRLDENEQPAGDKNLPIERALDMPRGGGEAQREEHTASRADRADVEESPQDDRKSIGLDHLLGGASALTANAKVPFITWPSSATAVHDTW